MGGSHGSSGSSGDLKLVTVSTENLKQKLNRIYKTKRSSHNIGCNAGLFEYLWDLKELALLEGRDNVQVPTTWLEELEHEFDSAETVHAGH